MKLPPLDQEIHDQLTEMMRDLDNLRDGYPSPHLSIALGHLQLADRELLHACFDDGSSDDAAQETRVRFNSNN